MRIIFDKEGARKKLANTKMFVESPEKANELKELLKYCGFELMPSAVFKELPFIYIGDKYVSAGLDYRDFYQDDGHELVNINSILTAIDASAL